MCTYFSAHKGTALSTALHCRGSSTFRRNRDLGEKEKSTHHGIPYHGGLLSTASVHRAPSTTVCIYGDDSTQHTDPRRRTRPPHHTGHNTPCRIALAEAVSSAHPRPRALSAQQRQCEPRRRVFGALLCCAQPSVPTWPGERKHWVLLPYVVVRWHSRFALTRAHTTSKQG